MRRPRPTPESLPDDLKANDSATVEVNQPET